MDVFEDGTEVVCTLLDSFFAIAKYVKYQHPFVDWLYKEYDYFKEPEYKNICTYILYNPETEKIYIGSGNADTREGAHINALIRGDHVNKKFQSSYNKNSNFNFYYIKVNTRKEALALEQIYIDLFWGNSLLLNLARYVEIPNIGNTASEETKKKQSEKATVRWNSEVLRSKQSYMQKNVWNDYNHVLKMGKIQKSLWENAEHRAIHLTEERRLRDIEKCKKMHAITSTPIQINGVKYASQAIASDVLKIPNQTISYRLNSNNFDNYVFLNKS